MSTRPLTVFRAANHGRLQRALRKARRAPVIIANPGGPPCVLMALKDYRKLAPERISATARGSVEPTATDGVGVRPVTFQVLCRIDAYADYVTEIEAATADEAVELAHEEHDDYCWEFRGTIEFDDRRYVALDKRGNEIEGAELGDF